MSLLIDLILITVFALCVYHYTKKGFAHSLLGMARFWLALIPAMAFSGWLADKIQPFVSANIGNKDGASFVSEIVERLIHSGYVSRVLAFAILFFAIAIAIKLIELLLKLLFELPLLRFMNKALGILLGAAIGFLWIQILSLIFMAGAELLSGSVAWLTPDYFDNAILARYLYDNNLFRFLFEKLSAA